MAGRGRRLPRRRSRSARESVRPWWRIVYGSSRMASGPVVRMLCLAPLAGLLVAASARAAPLRTPHFVKLEYVRGPGTEKTCPSEAMARHAILARLDEDPFLDTAKAALRVTVVRSGEQFRASYELCDENGECMDGPPVPARRMCLNAVESVAFSA